MREPDRRHKFAKALRASLSLPEVLLWRELAAERIAATPERPLSQLR